MDLLCYFRSWSFPPDLSPDWMADCALCVGGMRWLACLFWGEPALRPWGPRFRGALYLGQTQRPWLSPVVCSFRYLVFQLRVNARLPVIYVGVGEADSGAS